MPNRSSLATGVLSVVALLPALRNSSDTNGATVDTRGYDDVKLVAVVGAPGDTLSGSVKIEFEVEHSDDGSVWADVADADLVRSVVGTNPGTFAVVDANAEASQTYQTGYIGGKRYVRIVENRTGTHTTGTPTAAVVELGSPARAPVV